MTYGIHPLGTPPATTELVWSRDPVTADLACSYTIRESVTSDLACSYTIRSSVSAGLACSYAIRSAIAADLALGYAIRTLAVADLELSYTISGQPRAALTSMRYSWLDRAHNARPASAASSRPRSAEARRRPQ